MIPSWAKTGAKVVCVDRTAWVDIDDCVGMEGPTFGEICEISYVEFDLGRVWISLVGYDEDTVFNLASFRPLIEQKDDIALFTHLLNTKSEDQLIKEEA